MSTRQCANGSSPSLRSRAVTSSRSLKLYFLERFLYRLSISRSRDKDIDLEALAMEPDLDGLRRIVAVIAAIAAPEDGVRFDPESVSVESIREDDRYGGL